MSLGRIFLPYKSGHVEVPVCTQKHTWLVAMLPVSTAVLPAASAVPAASTVPPMASAVLPARVRVLVAPLALLSDCRDRSACLLLLREWDPSGGILAALKSVTCSSLAPWLLILSWARKSASMPKSLDAASRRACLSIVSLHESLCDMLEGFASQNGDGCIEASITLMRKLVGACRRAIVRCNAGRGTDSTAEGAEDFLKAAEAEHTVLVARNSREEAMAVVQSLLRVAEKSALKLANRVDDEGRVPEEDAMKPSLPPLRPTAAALAPPLAAAAATSAAVVAKRPVLERPALIMLPGATAPNSRAAAANSRLDQLAYAGAVAAAKERDERRLRERMEWRERYGPLWQEPMLQPQDGSEAAGRQAATQGTEAKETSMGDGASVMAADATSHGHQQHVVSASAVALGAAGASRVVGNKYAAPPRDSVAKAACALVQPTGELGGGTPPAKKLPQKELEEHGADGGTNKAKIKAANKAANKAARALRPVSGQRTMESFFGRSSTS